MSITIKSNNIPRPLFPVVWNDDEGWVREDEYSFDTVDGFEYRGGIYAVSEFEVASHDLKAQGFDGLQPESAFSAVVVRFFDREGYEYDGEIVVGYAHW